MSISELRDHKYILLTTFRKNGTPVPTAVLFALDGDRILVHTSLYAVLHNLRNIALGRLFTGSLLQMLVLRSNW